MFKTSLPALILTLALSGILHAQSHSALSEGNSINGLPVQQDPSVRIIENYINPKYARPRSSGGRGNPGRGSSPMSIGDYQPISKNELSLSSCYENTSLTGGFLNMFPGREYADWASKSCGSSDIVGRIGFGIRTSNLPISQGGPGWRIGMRLHQTTDSLGTRGALIADYTLTGAGAPFVGMPAAVIVGELDLPTPIVVGDYDFFAGWIGFTWSYYFQEFETGALLVATTGSPCASPLSPPDPITNTYDCIVEYDLASGTPLNSFTPAPGQGSLYLQLWEEDPFAAQIGFRSQSPNVDSYSCGTMVIGQTWDADVLVVQSGHTSALVFGFDTPLSFTLSSGYNLLIGDGGSGEMLGLTTTPGPLASFSLTVPFDLSLVGRYVGTQGIVIGGGTGAGPYALTNAIDCTIGTY